MSVYLLVSDLCCVFPDFVLQLKNLGEQRQWKGCLIIITLLSILSSWILDCERCLGIFMRGFERSFDFVIFSLHAGWPESWNQNSEWSGLSTFQWDENFILVVSAIPRTAHNGSDVMVVCQRAIWNSKIVLSFPLCSVWQLISRPLDSDWSAFAPHMWEKQLSMTKLSGSEALQAPDWYSQSSKALTTKVARWTLTIRTPSYRIIQLHGLSKWSQDSSLITVAVNRLESNSHRYLGTGKFPSSLGTSREKHTSLGRRRPLQIDLYLERTHFLGVFMDQSRPNKLHSSSAVEESKVWVKGSMCCWKIESRQDVLTCDWSEWKIVDSTWVPRALRSEYFGSRNLLSCSPILQNK